MVLGLLKRKKERATSVKEKTPYEKALALNAQLNINPIISSKNVLSKDKFRKVYEEMVTLLEQIPNETKTIVQDSITPYTYTSRPDLLLLGVKKVLPSRFDENKISSILNRNPWMTIIPSQYFLKTENDSVEFHQNVHSYEPSEEGLFSVNISCSPTNFGNIPHFYDILDERASFSPYRKTLKNCYNKNLIVPLVSPEAVNAFSIALDNSLKNCPSSSVLYKHVDYLKYLLEAPEGRNILGKDYLHLKQRLPIFKRNQKRAMSSCIDSVVQPLVDFYQAVQDGEYGVIEKR